ncbi:hypothetical protein HRR83_004231 [Exophiala dermatitidis]|uniref:Uncharacterized protein n=1 Tax=Exophiala dermatitidis TaxID=5970 RepID=A0AAN6IU90_EXODE|nr:hypothetical protein HRR73_006306 [Exophiala dermatitidis]KAJ4517796.1 hypothetical protein HRR75_003015 [Exophiala dermatitidis]KAJ4521463.1 hypothetical protein HRR74_003287 [Exophiala dermatitidis]KAJ4542137.1 hypothetical protein HRR77_006022 [Exophiala dermatitidis]KAJ4544902.1 hypothetical protein HRR76_002939 [Exophiala dermatitidis]
MPQSKLQRRPITPSTTYTLAHTAQCKLKLAANRPDRNLRFVLGHAFTLDNLMLRIVEIENQSAKSAFREGNKSPSSSSPPGRNVNNHYDCSATKADEAERYKDRADVESDLDAAPPPYDYSTSSTNQTTARNDTTSSHSYSHSSSRRISFRDNNARPSSTSTAGVGSNNKQSSDHTNKPSSSPNPFRRNNRSPPPFHPAGGSEAISSSAAAIEHELFSNEKNEASESTPSTTSSDDYDDPESIIREFEGVSLQEEDTSGIGAGDDRDSDVGATGEALSLKRSHRENNQHDSSVNWDAEDEALELADDELTLDSTTADEDADSRLSAVTNNTDVDAEADADVDRDVGVLAADDEENDEDDSGLALRRFDSASTQPPRGRSPPPESTSLESLSSSSASSASSSSPLSVRGKEQKTRAGPGGEEEEEEDDDDDDDDLYIGGNKQSKLQAGPQGGKKDPEGDPSIRPEELDLEAEKEGDAYEENDETENEPITPPQLPADVDIKEIVQGDKDLELTSLYESVRRCRCHGHQDSVGGPPAGVWDVPMEKTGGKRLAVVALASAA